MRSEQKRAIGVVIVRADREIGSYQRTFERSKRKGEIDYFMGGEVKDEEIPFQAVIREFGEKARFSWNKVMECGVIDSTVPEGRLRRTIFRADVPSGVEPIFTDPLPNQKLLEFKWIAIEVLRKMVERDELNPEVLQMLQMVGLVSITHKINEK